MRPPKWGTIGKNIKSEMPKAGMDESALRKIGFTHGEAKVYMALVGLGPASAGPIAKEAGVARSKLYDILERLSKKGVAGYSVKNGTRVFSAAQPSRILDFLKKKEDEIREEYAIMEKLLPGLEAEYAAQAPERGAEVFEGLEGLKNVRERFVRSAKKGGIAYFLGVPPSAYDRMEAYYADWNERRIRKGVKSYTIFTEEARGHPYVREKGRQKLTYFRFLPKGFQSHAWMEIYGDSAVIAVNREKPMSIVISNALVAESYMGYFNLLWKMSRP